MARKKPERKQKKTNETFGLKNILNSKKTDFILGIILLAFSIYAIIAMVSFIRTGQADQSLLEQLHPGDWSNNERIFQNYGRSTGAIISYVLIKEWFGLPAFIIPLFFAVAGLKLMRIYTINLTKWFFYMTFVMFWTSVAFAKFLAPIMSDSIYNPGGASRTFLRSAPGKRHRSSGTNRNIAAYRHYLYGHCEFTHDERHPKIYEPRQIFDQQDKGDHHHPARDRRRRQSIRRYIYTRLSE